MRGRTLDYSFIILDEAQNTTPKQMKMFLTRFGKHSKVVVNGDVTQVDLEKGEQSGLVDAMNVLSNVKGIKFIHLTEKDIVRHQLVQDIVNAYEARKLFRQEQAEKHAEEADTKGDPKELSDSVIDLSKPKNSITERHETSALSRLLREQAEDEQASEEQIVEEQVVEDFVEEELVNEELIEDEQVEEEIIEDVFLDFDPENESQ